MTVLFWALAATIFYIYFGYGLLVILLASLRPRRRVLPSVQPLSATLLIAAHNEAPNIPRKLENALSLDLGPHTLEILVVSDGSRDDTALEARKFVDRGVRTIEIRDHVGKANAMNRALTEISTDVVVFSDADSAIDQRALVNLLRHFGDPEVGGVCGSIELAARKRGWLGQGEAMYWKYDHALRAAENRLSGAVSAQGTLYTVRRELLHPLVPAVADDSLNSLRVVAQGKRLVFESEATVELSVTSSSKLEFGRRVRMTERGWRGLMLMSQLLNPWRYGFFSVQLFSHKVLRRLGPFFLLLVAVANLGLIAKHPIYDVSAVLQAIFYALAGVGWAMAGRGKSWTSIPFFFVLGNCAMAIGVINALRGKRTDKWSPAREPASGK
jgi:cellulose synthase/poly-beta-1,6-N-acetylglucosamine synthase-like glycosyltransferase